VQKLLANFNWPYINFQETIISVGKGKPATTLQSRHVQEHFPIRIPIDSVQYWLEASAAVGQESAQWAHKADHRQRHTEPRS